MRKAISQWSFPGDQPLAERMALAKEAGFDGIEIALEDDPDGSLAKLGLLSMQAVEETAAGIKALAAQYELGIPAVAIGIGWKYQLTADCATARAEAIEVNAAGIRAARLLGADAVLILPGVVDTVFAPVVPPVPYDVCYQRSQESLRELIPVAAENRVYMGLEPVWNMFLLSPLEWVSFVDSLDSEWVKVYFDLGNVLHSGYPEQWIRILRERICRVHVKDFKRSIGGLEGFVELLTGDVNFPACMDALREVGYDSWLTAEMMGNSPYAPSHLVETAALAMKKIAAM